MPVRISIVRHKTQKGSIVQHCKCICTRLESCWRVATVVYDRTLPPGKDDRQDITTFATIFALFPWMKDSWSPSTVWVSGFFVQTWNRKCEVIWILSPASLRIKAIQNKSYNRDKQFFFKNQTNIGINSLNLELMARKCHPQQDQFLNFVS